VIVVFWKEVPFFGTSRAAIRTAACFKRLLLLFFFYYFIYRSQWIGGIFVVVAIRVIVQLEFSTFATKRNNRIDPNRRQMKVFVLRAKDLLRWRFYSSSATIIRRQKEVEIWVMSSFFVFRSIMRARRCRRFG